MSKIEAIAPYLNNDFDRHINRALTNLMITKDRVFDLLDISDNCKIFNDIGYIFVKWTSDYSHLCQGLLSFNFVEKSSTEIEFYFSTNLPDITNEVYLTVNVKRGVIEEYKNLRLFSCTNPQDFSNYTKNLYDDNFVIFPFIIYWLAFKIISRKSIEIDKDFNFDGLNIKYYQPDDENLIDIKLDFTKLDLVRDRWYDMLIEFATGNKD